MLKRRIDKPLISVIMFGIIEDFITVSLATFGMGKYIYNVLLLFVILSLISFPKFIYLLMLIFKNNLDQMAVMMDEKQNYDDEMMETIKKILISIDKDKK